MKIDYRVKTHQDFQKVIQNNRKEANKEFIVYYKNNSIGHERFGISASNKLGNAVLRVKIRRQVRMMCKNIFLNKYSVDYVIIVRRGYLDRKYQDNLDELNYLFTKIRGKLDEEKI